ncbi:MAG: transposase [bacterium]
MRKKQTEPIRRLIYFRNDRTLLTQLCRCAYKSLLEFSRITLSLEDALPGAVLTIHTFGDFPHKFHPHIHMIASDGLFLKNGLFM